MTVKTAIDADPSAAPTPTRDPWADLKQALAEAPAAERNTYINDWMHEFQPVTPSEIYFVRHAAVQSWTLGHVERFVAVADSARITEAIDACPGSSAEETARAAALASFDLSNSGERIRRYQISLHREVRKDLETFTKLRLQRLKREQENLTVTHQAESVVPVVPAPVSPPPPIQPASNEPIAPLKRIRLTQSIMPSAPIITPKPIDRPQASLGKKPRRPDPKQVLKEIRTGNRSKQTAEFVREARRAEFFASLAEEPRHVNASLESIRMLGSDG